MSYTIKKITTEQTYSIRQPVLRSGKPIESCFFDGDNLESTFHLGLFTEDKLIGVASFFKCSTNLLAEDNQYQLRGMAILKEFQKKGLGQLILNNGESLLKNEKVKIIWCNAREVATGFYKTNNYKTIGDSFNIKNVGLHYIMYKIL